MPMQIRDVNYCSKLLWQTSSDSEAPHSVRVQRLPSSSSGTPLPVALFLRWLTKRVLLPESALCRYSANFIFLIYPENEHDHRSLKSLIRKWDLGVQCFENGIWSFTEIGFMNMESATNEMLMGRHMQSIGIWGLYNVPTRVVKNRPFYGTNGL